MTTDREVGDTTQKSRDRLAAPFSSEMAALNVMDGRTERSERFFFELMHHGKRGAPREKSYDSNNIIPERRRCAITINVIA